ncbi:hypothetical protein HMPREF1255_1180 [Propionimicrobium sp. BV2F7]|nr:hypothetical protein HMPREF1255_1180 [Propionimicrobium sp. BV2F7]
MVSNENVCKRVTSSSKDLLGTEKNKTVSYVDRVKIESEKMVAIRKIPEIRMYELERISQALTSRKPGKLFKGQKLMVVACDHPPRGAKFEMDDQTNCYNAEGKRPAWMAEKRLPESTWTIRTPLRNRC